MVVIRYTTSFFLMTIDQLIDCDIAKLEAMSDAEIEEWFKPYLATIRPERSLKDSGNSVKDTVKATIRGRKTGKIKEQAAKLDPAKQALLASLGFGNLLK